MRPGTHTARYTSKYRAALATISAAALATVVLVVSPRSDLSSNTADQTDIVQHHQVFAQTVSSTVEGTDVTTTQTGLATFTGIGATWDAQYTPHIIAIRVRVVEHDVWTEWFDLTIEGDSPSSESEEGAETGGTDPLLTAGATGYEVVITARSEVFAKRVSIVTVDGHRKPASSSGSSLSRASTVGVIDPAAPPMFRRADWGADESLRPQTSSCQAPSFPSTNRTINAAMVHHTATTNSYTKSQAAGQVRTIYAYHTKGRNWCDVGYNFLVDKYGQIFEGRTLSSLQPTQGAHAGGFNSQTMGVSAIGTYTSVSPTWSTLNAIGRVIGWKLARHGTPTESTTTLTSAGSGTARYDRGTVVVKPNIMGHRDVGRTSCPGARLYAKLATIRRLATQTAHNVRPYFDRPVTAHDRTSESGTHPIFGVDNALPGTYTLVIQEFCGSREVLRQHFTLQPGRFTYTWNLRNMSGTKVDAGAYTWKLIGPSGTAAGGSVTVADSSRSFAGVPVKPWAGYYPPRAIEVITP